MKTKIYLIALLFVITNVLVKAQNPIGSVTASYQYPELTQVQLAGMNALQLQAERISLTTNISINNPQNITKIVVMLGSTEGSGDVFYKEFDYGVAGTFTDGTTYTVSGNGATIVLGTYSGIEHYYIEVAAMMQDGSKSDAVRVAVQ